MSGKTGTFPKKLSNKMRKKSFFNNYLESYLILSLVLKDPNAAPLFPFLVSRWLRRLGLIHFWWSHFVLIVFLLAPFPDDFPYLFYFWLKGKYTQTVVYGQVDTWPKCTVFVRPHVLCLKGYHLENAFLATLWYVESTFDADYFPEEVTIGIKKQTFYWTLLNSKKQSIERTIKIFL